MPRPRLRSRKDGAAPPARSRSRLRPRSHGNGAKGSAKAEEDARARALHAELVRDARALAVQAAGLEGGALPPRLGGGGAALRSTPCAPRRGAREEAALLQAVFNWMSYDWDQSLRTRGAGEAKARKLMQRLGQGFYGRLAAYEPALQAGPGAGEEALAEALLRNLPHEAAAAGAKAGRRDEASRLWAGAAMRGRGGEEAGAGRESDAAAQAPPRACAGEAAP